MNQGIISALLAAAVLAGCTSVQERSTNSQFAEVTADGTFKKPLGSPRTGSDVDANGEGYAYQVGTGANGGLAGQSGLLPGTDTQSWASSGTATLTGSYEVLSISGIGLDGDQIYGFSKHDSGAITLTADFAGNTLKGTSYDGALAINGEMSGKDMTGNATFNGVQGDLSGVAGSDQAFGVFHGNNEDLIFAGGFAATRD